MFHRKTNLAFIFISIFLFGMCTPERKTEMGQHEVRIRLQASPDKLSPILTVNSYSLQILQNIFPQLLTTDPYSLELVPVLAKSRPTIEKIEDGEFKGGSKISYEIREEAVWDDGKPVTAKDFEFTLKALFNPNVKAAPWRGYLAFLKDIEIDPANNKKFTLYADKQYILAEAASAFFIYPEHIYDSSGLLKNYSLRQLTLPADASSLSKDEQLIEFANQFSDPSRVRDPNKIISCGPYRLAEWAEGQHIILERKDDWWGAGLVTSHPQLSANPKRIIYKPIKDPIAATNGLKDGSVDVMNAIAPTSFVELKKNNTLLEQFNFSTPESMIYQYIGLNSKSPKLNDKRVRRALSHLLNYDEAIKSVVNGLAVRTVGPIHPSKSYYNDGLTPIPYDIEAAKKLLAEAGWKDTNGNGIVDKIVDGESVELSLTLAVPAGGSIQKGVATFLQQDAEKAQVKINVEVQEFSRLREELKNRTFEMYALAAQLGVDLDDPFQFWHTAMDTPNGGNRSGFGNEVSDNLIDNIRSSFDATEQNRLYREFQSMIYDEQPFIFVFVPLERIAVKKEFDNSNPSVKPPGYEESYFIKSDQIN